MKYKAIIETDDYKDFEFFEDGNGKYLHTVDANAINNEWIALYFTEYQQEPCDDCISRQAVLDIIDSDWKYEGMEQYINELPSVTPQPKTDVLDKIRAEIDLLSDSRCDGITVTIYSWDGMKRKVLDIINKYMAEN